MNYLIGFMWKTTLLSNQLIGVVYNVGTGKNQGKIFLKMNKFTRDEEFHAIKDFLLGTYKFTGNLTENEISYFKEKSFAVEDNAKNYLEQSWTKTLNSYKKEQIDNFFKNLEK